MTKEEKRQLVLDSIDFLNKKRNISLFQIHQASTQMQQAKKRRKEALKKSLFFKRRIIDEVLKNVEVLTEEDKRKFIIDKEED